MKNKYLFFISMGGRIFFVRRIHVVVVSFLLIASILGLASLSGNLALKVQVILLKRENALLKKEIDALERTIESVREEAKIAISKANEVRILAGLEPVPEEIAYTGIGGYIDDEEKPMEEIRSLLNIVHAQKEDILRIKELIQERKEALERTPSISPVNGGFITSSFGWRKDPFTGRYKMHEGIDISAPYGTPVYATAKGRVVYAGFKGGYGLVVEIDHGNGTITRYAHLSKILVRAGQKVVRGDIIGRVGNTGRSTGPHVHYEVIVNGNARNPKLYILNSDVVLD